jgi:hypothetical protein
MKSIAKVMNLENAFSKSNIMTSILWAIVGLISTYLTTLSPEAQISGQAFCSLFTNSGNGFHEMGFIGHCPYCYVAVAAFGASLISLFKKA